MSKLSKHELDKDELTFALEEYKTLRAEILSKMDNQYKILSLGIGGIAILFGAIDKIAIDELFAVMPFLIIANAFLYRIESMAIINAGIYIRDIEKIIYYNHNNLNINDKMGWETRLKREVYKPFNYVADIIFTVLYFLSIFKVSQCLIIPNLTYKLTPAVFAIIIYIIAILFLFIRYLGLIIKYRKLITNVS